MAAKMRMEGESTTTSRGGGEPGGATEEMIAFVPRHALVSRRWLGQGFRGDDERCIYDGLLDALRYGPRGPLERDPERKQIIPYVVLTDGAGAVYTLRRKRAQTEARLHDKLSFGVGGHIDRIDAEGRALDPIHQGMLRELHEELSLEQPYRLRYRGILNDDTTEVGQVHLGAVFTCHVGERAQVVVRETDKMEGRWLEVAEIEARADRLETWSALLLPYLERWL